MENFSVTLERQLAELTTTIVNAVNEMRETIVTETEKIRNAKRVLNATATELSSVANILEDFGSDIDTIVTVADTLSDTADDLVDCIDTIPEEDELNAPIVDLDEDTPIYETDENGHYHSVE